jgi:glycosyltransferase involved in cell wall biosynthesis
VSKRVLVVSNDHVGTQMAGPGIRSYHFAQELANHFSVTLCVPDASEIALDGVELVTVEPTDSRALTRLALEHDAVVSQRLPVNTAIRLAASTVRVVYDLYAPVPLELLASRNNTTPTLEMRLHERHERRVLETALATGDAFICASDRQRDLWLGWLGALGRLDATRYARDPSFRGLIDVVPFGIDDVSAGRERVLRGVMPGVESESKILVWAGGLWNWLDPLTIIHAVAELGRLRDDVRLVFLGTHRPNPAIKRMSMTDRALELADELGIRDTLVFFNDGWVPYSERGAWLAEADIGVSAHFGDIETRFAFRTRLLDYLWAGLPIVTTDGDVLSTLVSERRLGRTVGVGDVDGWREALGDVLEDEAEMGEIRGRVAEEREQFRWSRVTEPLVALAGVTGERVVVPARIRANAITELPARGLLSLRYRGPTGALTHAARRLDPRHR